MKEKIEIEVTYNSDPSGNITVLLETKTEGAPKVLRDEQGFACDYLRVQSKEIDYLKCVVDNKIQEAKERIKRIRYDMKNLPKTKRYKI